MRGWFITFEGIDGCGKSTHMERLAQLLAGRGMEPVVTREPGGTSLGERVREMLLSTDGAGITPMAELLLYAADRAQHMTEVVRPALDAGRIVLSDRYTDSTVAFQGYGRGLDLRVIRELNRIATGGLVPNLTILLDIEPAVARSRLDSRRAGSAGDRFHEEAHDFHSRVREAYLALAAAEPDRFRIIDSGSSVDLTQERIVSAVVDLVAGDR